MKTIDLTREHATLEELLKLALTGSVRILTRDDHAFVLEAADDIDKEVDSIARSEKFGEFLNKRSVEPAIRSFDAYRQSRE